MESKDDYSKKNAEEAEQRVSSGKAILARAWLEADPDSRRIGEVIHANRSCGSIDKVTSFLGLGIEEMWVDDIALDEHGKSYARREIWKLPKRKRRRVIFRGLAIQLTLGGFPVIQDVGQDYVLVPLPSAEQVRKAQAQLEGR